MSMFSFAFFVILLLKDIFISIYNMNTLISIEVLKSCSHSNLEGSPLFHFLYMAQRPRRPTADTLPRHCSARTDNSSPRRSALRQTALAVAECTHLWSSSLSLCQRTRCDRRRQSQSRFCAECQHERVTLLAYELLALAI